MLRRSIAARILAVILTGGLALMTGLVAAGAVTGTMEGPDAVLVDDTHADGCTLVSAGDDCTQDGVVEDDTESDSGADDGTEAGGDDDDGTEPSHGKHAGDSDEPANGEDANHGDMVSSIAKSAEPGPGHGLEVCRVASAGACQPNHDADEAASDDADDSDDGDDGAEEAEHASKGRGPAEAAEARGKQKTQQRH